MSHALLLDWLPPPRDFTAELEAAARVEDEPSRLAALGALAQQRLTFLETLKLDRALAREVLLPAAGYAAVRLAVLGSCTVDHLIPSIRVAGMRRRLKIAAYVGGYGQYRQELLNGSAALRSFAPEFVLLSLTAREAIGSVALTATATETEEAVRRYVGEHRGLWRRIKDEHGATAVQQTFLDTTDPLFGSLDRGVPGTPGRLIRLLN